MSVHMVMKNSRKWTILNGYSGYADDKEQKRIGLPLSQQPRVGDIVSRKMKQFMRWISSNLLSRLRGVFPTERNDLTERDELAVNAIKQAMLKELEHHKASRFAQTQLRIQYADNAQDLWYLRGDLMTAISHFCGESSAYQRIANINKLFSGLVSPNLLSNKKTEKPGRSSN